MAGKRVAQTEDQWDAGKEDRDHYYATQEDDEKGGWY
jgi:hypothetical protein